MDDFNVENKKHRKAKVKKTTSNARAHTFNSGVRANRALRRNLDRATNRHHLPVERYEGETEPPVIVAVVGPPKVGKSTLIASLIKRYNKQQISNIKGPVTIVTAKDQRVTLIECNNDINSMIDLAKVADLVLILADATFGFEMEIFEFLNILHVHGFPKVIGIMTHLDLLQANKSLSRYKKKLKTRFWKEVYDGAKIFYIDDFNNNLYNKKQMMILSRYISISKIPPPAWRLTHPYVLVDRVEDLTDPEVKRTDPQSNRLVTFYGYLHGTYMRHTNKVHIPGCGDYNIKNMCFIPDPCERPESVKKRILDESERVMYAPFSGVGNIVYDKDAVYINTGGSKNINENPMNEEITEQNVRISSILDIKQTIDAKLSSAPIQIFQDGPMIYDDEFDTQLHHIKQETVSNDKESIQHIDVEQNKFRNTNEYFSDVAHHIGLYRSIYTPVEPQPIITSAPLESVLVEKKPVVISYKDTTMLTEKAFDWSDDIIFSSLKDRCFNTCFESQEDEEDKYIHRDTDGSENEDKIGEEDEKASKLRIRKMLEQDEKYLTGVKEKVKETVEMHDKEFENMSAEERVLFQGYQPGMYVRIEIQEFPHEFIDYLDPMYPIVIGSLLPGEDDMGYMKLRVKKHRFYDKILKTSDPIILSAGWKRFQTIPLYAVEDHNKRLRAIKYTPKFMHCIAVCYGPVMQPSFGVVGIQKIAASKDVGFRIAITGVTLENDKCCRVVKKLKLIGYPFQIYKNSAFIDKMFSTSLEVSKFEGALIKTVSGIRGHVKKPVSDREGAFRAKFEDKILMSDIVFLRSWIPLECPHFHYPLPNLLMPREDRLSWSGMRTVTELRKELEVPLPPKEDSNYQQIERLPVKFAPLRIPSNLLKQLPFSAKPKNMLQPTEKVSHPQLKDNDDKKALALLNELSLIHKDTTIKKSLKRQQATKQHKEKLQKIEDSKIKRNKIKQKLIYRMKPRS